MIAEDLAEIIHDPEGPASLCTLELPGLEPFGALMIVRPSYGGDLDPRGKLFAWAGSGDMPRGADWGYGLVLASDLPVALEETTVGKVTDSRGYVWRVEAARPVLETDPESRELRAVAWRLALRGTQRATRGK